MVGIVGGESSKAPPPFLLASTAYLHRASRYDGARDFTKGHGEKKISGAFAFSRNRSLKRAIQEWNIRYSCGSFPEIVSIFRNSFLRPFTSFRSNTLRNAGS